MRWPVYAWSSGADMHLWARGGEDAERAGVYPIESWCLEEGWAGGLSMPQALYDELVVIRFAQIVNDGLLTRTVRRLRTSCATSTTPIGKRARTAGALA